MQVGLILRQKNNMKSLHSRIELSCSYYSILFIYYYTWLVSPYDIIEGFFFYNLLFLMIPLGETSQVL